MAISTYTLSPDRQVVRNDHKVMQFPGGEAHTFLAEETNGAEAAYLQGADGNDLMKLAMWADACKRSHRPTIAVIPYLPGARQDRGIPLGAKVYADFINRMELDEVICFDPHSDVEPALLDRVTAVSLDQVPEIWAGLATEPFAGVIAPDAGARKRAELAAGVLGLPVFQATKHRDPATGKLSGFACEPLPDKGKLLVVDDICDGGGTFLGLADSTGLPPERLALWVSHGVFSNGAKRLVDRYGLIATTDSHPGHENDDLPDVRITPLFERLVGFARKAK